MGLELELELELELSESESLALELELFESESEVDSSSFGSTAVFSIDFSLLLNFGAGSCFAFEADLFLDPIF